MTPEVAYADTANKLRDRIADLIPEHPEILQLDDAWGLFGIKEFHCDDLQPSLAQAGWALSAAKKKWAAGKGESDA